MFHFPPHFFSSSHPHPPCFSHDGTDRGLSADLPALHVGSSGQRRVDGFRWEGAALLRALPHYHPRQYGMYYYFFLSFSFFSFSFSFLLCFFFSLFFCLCICFLVFIFHCLRYIPFFLFFFLSFFPFSVFFCSNYFRFFFQVDASILWIMTTT